MARKQIIAKSSTIWLASFCKQAVNAKSKLPAPKVAGVCCQGWKFTQGAMHLIYQSRLALISCDEICTRCMAGHAYEHGGLFFVQIRV
ncbi:MAG: hypothetical protein KJ773_00390, partial [Candidatus Thermoplasmatota archaeon]|nr:hypothetical protein [Candidatus Thermoplasmatota archaeon]